MSHSFRYQYRDDYRLLGKNRQHFFSLQLARSVYALLGLVGQTLLAVYYIVIYSVGIAYPQVNATAQRAYPYINNLLALGDAVCLFVTR